MAIIYRISHKITNKAYIGASKNSIDKVKAMHIKDGRKYVSQSYSPSINWAIKQEGAKAFYWEILKDNIPSKELDYWETHFIAQYNTFHEGYNTTIDGKPHTAYETQLMRMGKWKAIIHPTITAVYLWYMKGIVIEDD